MEEAHLPTGLQPLLGKGCPRDLTTMYFLVVQIWVQCSQGPSSKLQAVKPTCYRITCAKGWLQQQWLEKRWAKRMEEVQKRCAWYHPKVIRSQYFRNSEEYFDKELKRGLVHTTVNHLRWLLFEKRCQQWYSSNFEKKKNVRVTHNLSKFNLNPSLNAPVYYHYSI